MLRLAFGITPEDKGYDDLRDEFFANYEAALTELTQPFEGVPELVLSLLRQQRGWGVVTNKMERFTHPIVKGMTLFDTAGAVVCGDTTPHPKPHPAPLLEAAQRMGVDPARAQVAAIGNLYYRDGVTAHDNAVRFMTLISADALGNVLKEFWPDVKRKFLTKHPKP